MPVLFEQIDAARTRRLQAGVAVLVLLVGIGMIVLGAFLPWVISGTSTRSSFETVRSAERLGLVDGEVALAVLRGWYLVPLAAALVPVLLSFHRVRTAAIIGMLLAAITGSVAAIVVLATPDRGIGPMVSIAGAGVVLVCAFVVLITTPAGRPPRRRRTQ